MATNAIERFEVTLSGEPFLASMYDRKGFVVFDKKTATTETHCRFACDRQPDGNWIFTFADSTGISIPIRTLADACQWLEEYENKRTFP